MHRRPVLRNSLVIAAVVVVSLIAAMVLPLTRRANAADAPAGQSAGKGDPALDAAAPRQQETADTREISVLIRQLGDPAYAVRQRATKRLIEVGIATQPFLTQALDDDDAEVRSRAGQVLAQVVEADFHLRLEAFANDLEGRQQHTLPCWGRFSQVFGQDKVSRMLFVEMQMAEPALLEALDTNPKLAGELFGMRMQSIVQSLQFPLRDGSGQPPLGTTCSLLLVSAADGVTVSDQDAVQLLNLIQQPTFQRSLSGSVESDILRKMLGAWIVHNSSSALAHQSFFLAFAFDLKEGLDLAVKLLSNEGGGQLPAPAIRQDALLAIGRFGNHEHIALVEPLLKDTSACSQQQPGNERQSQVCDVALAVLVHLSGQELKDYGLDHIPSNSRTLFQPGTITFTDPLMRKEALRKWELWAGRGGAGATDKPAAGKESPSEPAGGKPAATPAPVPDASGAAVPDPKAPAAKGPDGPAVVGGQPTAPRPAELVP